MRRTDTNQGIFFCIGTWVADMTIIVFVSCVSKINHWYQLLFRFYYTTIISYYSIAIYCKNLQRKNKRLEQIAKTPGDFYVFFCLGCTARCSRAARAAMGPGASFSTRRS